MRGSGRRLAAGACLLTSLFCWVAPMALAQVPAPPDPQGVLVVVTWTWDPPEPAVLQGGTVQVRGVAHVVVHDTACLADSQLTVTLPLASRDDAPGLTVEPALSFDVTVPAGVYGVAGLPSFETNAEVPLVVQTTSATPPGTHALVGDTTASTALACVHTELLGNGGGAPAGPTAGFEVVVRAADEANHPAHGGAFDLTIEAGRRANATLTANGTYPYHDHLHPALRGKVLVGNGSAAADVRITKDGFDPQEVHVAAGGIVNWINDDNTTHRVSAEAAQLEQAPSAAPPPPPPRPAAPPPPPAEEPTEEGPSPLALQPEPEPKGVPAPSLVWVALAALGAALLARRDR